MKDQPVDQERRAPARGQKVGEPRREAPPEPRHRECQPVRRMAARRRPGYLLELWQFAACQRRHLRPKPQPALHRRLCQLHHRLCSCARSGEPAPRQQRELLVLSNACAVRGALRAGCWPRGRRRGRPARRGPAHEAVRQHSVHAGQLEHIEGQAHAEEHDKAALPGAGCRVDGPRGRAARPACTAILSVALSSTAALSSTLFGVARRRGHGQGRGSAPAAPSPRRRVWPRRVSFMTSSSALLRLSAHGESKQ